LSHFQGTGNESLEGKVTPHFVPLLRRSKFLVAAGFRTAMCHSYCFLDCDIIVGKCLPRDGASDKVVFVAAVAIIVLHNLEGHLGCGMFSVSAPKSPCRRSVFCVQSFLLFPRLLLTRRFSSFAAKNLWFADLQPGKGVASATFATNPGRRKINFQQARKRGKFADSRPRRGVKKRTLPCRSECRPVLGFWRSEKLWGFTR
jgi:hypothetical protein